MKKIILLLMVSVVALTLTACNAENPVCGEGTTMVGDACILDSLVPKDDKTTQVTACADGPGPHEVVNGEFVNPPAEPWFFIGGYLVSQPDEIWMEDFDAIIFDVSGTSNNVWDGAFWQPKIYTEVGCTYTVTFTLRTDEAAGRDVIVFLEDTDNNYFKFIEETVTLSTEYQTFTYIFEPLETNNDTKIGIFFANQVGTVIIDSILVTRDPS